MTDLPPQNQTPADAAPLSFRPTLIFLSLAALFIFFQLFRLPLTPIFFEGDHYVHLSNAWRMLTGDAAFRDFFLVTFPGTEIYYLALFNLFGVSNWILNATIFSLLVGLSALGVYFSRRLLNGWAAFLPIALFLVVGLRYFGIDGSHRFFSALAVFAAVAVIFERRSFARLAAAGLLCGVAASFTQPRGFAGMAAIAVFLVVEKFYARQSFGELFKRGLAAALPFGLVVALILAYFVTAAGFETFYFATFVFPVKHYPADSWNNFGAYLREFPPLGAYSLLGYLKLTAPFLFVYLLTPAIYPIFWLVFWLKRKNLNEQTKLRLVLLNLAGMFLTLGIFSAPSATRLYQVSLPAFISLVWILQTVLPRRVPFAPLLLAALALVGVSYSVQRQTVAIYTLVTPSGNLCTFSEAAAARYFWAAANTKPLDYLYEPHHPSLYSIFQLKNPTPLSWLRPNGFTTDQHVADVIDGLRKNPPRYVVWNGAWNKMADENRPDFHLRPLVDYMNANYVFRERLNEFNDHKGDPEYYVEIWEKKSF